MSHLIIPYFASRIRSRLLDKRSTERAIRVFSVFIDAELVAHLILAVSQSVSDLLGASVMQLAVVSELEFALYFVVLAFGGLAFLDKLDTSLYVHDLGGCDVIELDDSLLVCQESH